MSTTPLPLTLAAATATDQLADLKKPVDELQISVKAEEWLESIDCTHVWQVAVMSEDELKEKLAHKIRANGGQDFLPKFLVQVNESLEVLELSLGMLFAEDLAKTLRPPVKAEKAKKRKSGKR